MDMIGPRAPRGARPAGPILQAERDAARLPGAKLECLAGGNVEQPAICFQTIFARRQIERCAPVQQKEVRLVVASHFQRFRRSAGGPKALAIEQVDPEGKYRLHGAQTEWPV